MTAPLLVLDTRCGGDVEACRALAARLGALEVTVEEARAGLDAAMTSALAWQGTSAELAAVALGETRSSLAAIARATRGFARALVAFGAELRAVQAELETARASARRAGFTVTGDAIHLVPQGMACASSLADVALRWSDTDARAVRAQVMAARQREQAAHAALRAVISPHDSFWRATLKETGVLPAGDSVFDRAVYGANLVVTDTSVSVERAGSDGPWLGRLGHALGAAGAALTFTAAVHDQLEADADDEQLSGVDRGLRAVVGGGAVASMATIGSVLGGNIVRGAMGAVGLTAAPATDGASVPLAVAVGGAVGSALGSAAGARVGAGLSAPVVKAVPAAVDVVETVVSAPLDSDCDETFNDAVADLVQWH